MPLLGHAREGGQRVGTMSVLVVSRRRLVASGSDEVDDYVVPISRRAFAAAVAAAAACSVAAERGSERGPAREGARRNPGSGARGRYQQQRSRSEHLLLRPLLLLLLLVLLLPGHRFRARSRGYVCTTLYYTQRSGKRMHEPLG